MGPILHLSAAPSTTPLYLAVHGCVEGSHLSPRVMLWSQEDHDSTLLIDLSPTARYWRQQATERGLTFEEFLKTLLPQGTEAVLAEHPWQAILYLKTLSARGQGQLVNLNSHFGRSLVRSLSWESWQDACHEIFAHFAEVTPKAKPKKETSIRNLRSLLQTRNRMQFPTPVHLKEAESASIRRRFGEQLSKLWEWTWTPATLPALSSYKDGFPWRLKQPSETPSVQTLLNHPLREWDHIEPFLREDLDRICNLACWSSSERVVSLEWELSFSNSPTLTIPVLFRHPHSLHREAGHHKTALLQAFHSWQSTLNKRLRDSHFKNDTQYLDNDALCEWRLIVKERLIVPPHARSLFDDDLDSPPCRLRDLENTLPIDLEMFDLTKDWTPEGSWQSIETSITTSTPEKQKSQAQQRDNDLCDYIPSLEAQHFFRPLFIQNIPSPISKQISGGLVFRERVMDKWWNSGDTSNHIRDYYLRFGEQAALQWVFADQRGDLFLHGIYG